MLGCQRKPGSVLGLGAELEIAPAFSRGAVQLMHGLNKGALTKLMNCHDEQRPLRSRSLSQVSTHTTVQRTLGSPDNLRRKKKKTLDCSFGTRSEKERLDPSTHHLTLASAPFNQYRHSSHASSL